MNAPNAIEWLDDREFLLDDLRFTCISAFDRVNPSGTDHFVIVKPRKVIERYSALVRGATVVNLLELGIHRGGSTVLFERMLRPARMIALDLMPGPCLPLEGFIDRRGMRNTYSIHYGVDQADVGALERILTESDTTRSLDLVIDDASHHYAATRASFTALFPHLHPGGRYIIEDWAWAQSGAQFVLPESWLRTPALGVLLFECIAVNAARSDVIAEVTIGPGFATVTRGPAALDPAAFAIEDYYLGRSGELVERLLAAWPPADSRSAPAPPSP